MCVWLWQTHLSPCAGDTALWGTCSSSFPLLCSLFSCFFEGSIDLFRALWRSIERPSLCGSRGFVRPVCPLPGRTGSSVTGPPPLRGRVHVITHKRLGLYREEQTSVFKPISWVVVPANWVNSSSSLIVVSHTLSSYRGSSQLSFTLLREQEYLYSTKLNIKGTYMIFTFCYVCPLLPFLCYSIHLCNLSFLLPFFLFLLAKDQNTVRANLMSFRLNFQIVFNVSIMAGYKTIYAKMHMF